MQTDVFPDPDSYLGKLAISLAVKLGEKMISRAAGEVRDKFEGDKTLNAFNKCLRIALGKALQRYEQLTQEDKDHLDTQLHRLVSLKSVQDKLLPILEGKNPDVPAILSIYNKELGDPTQLPGLDDFLSDFCDFFWTEVSKDSILQPIIEVRISKTTLTVVEKMFELMNKPHQSAKERYLFHLFQKCEDLQLSSLGDTEKNKKTVSLDAVFIPLDTTADKEHFSRKKSDQPPSDSVERGNKEKRLPALEALLHSRQMVLLGDPGSGKSTFVKHLCAAQAPALLKVGDPILDLPRDTLPILITLREIAPAFAKLAAQNLGNDLYKDAILGITETYFSSQNWSKDFAEILQREYLETGKCLLVFDGLDEVPFAQRAAVREGVEACIKQYKPEMLVVTCRINAYGDGQDLEGLKDFTLAPLNRKQIDGFIERWYKARVALKRETPEAAEVGIIDLKKAVRGEGISDMAENPMLLTTLTLLYQGKTRLPDQRVAVYDRAIKILIEDWQQAKGHIPAPLRDLLSGEILLREILEELAYQAHQNKNKDGEYDLSRMLALAVLKEKLDSEELAGHFLDYVDQKAGIFIGKGGVSNQVVAYGFAHRTFQEYLAGCRLTADNRSYYRDLVENYLSNPDEWALAIQLGLEELYYNRKNSLFLRDQAYQLFRGDVPETLESRRGVLIAAEIARLVNPENIRKDQHCPKKWMEHLATTLTTLLRLPDFPARDRCQAGVKLGHLGDTRPAVLVVDQMEVALIPPGPFWMGSPDSDDMRSQDEKLHRNEALNYPYWLSRFPVSNAQFQTFVEDQGYADQRWWAEAQEAGYWNPKGIKVYGDETERMAPVDFGHPFSLPNHPVVGISWYEMLAFCRWLTTRWQSKGWLRGNWEVFLPSEAEWEKGSRGGLQLPEEPIIRGIDQGITFQRLDLPKDNPQPQRRYPWGEEPDPKHMNTFETRIKGTSALGAFPGGASPYGLEEISGNVWEWTRSLWSDLPYDPKDGREKLNLDKGRVVRGGAFHLNQRGACGSCRGDVNPDGRFSGGGFRIVLVPIERTAER